MAKGTFSRKGLHKLECQTCDGFMYATVAMLEARGLPPCWCGERLQPCELELAMILNAVDARPMVEYNRECNSVAKGQAPHGQIGRVLRSPEDVAAERVEVSRQAQDRRRRRRVVIEPMPF